MATTKAINIRIQDEILSHYRKYADLTGLGYQTVIKFTLAQHVGELAKENQRLQEQANNGEL